MTEVKFKVGDKVYCPNLSTSILTLVDGVNGYPIAIKYPNVTICFMTDGKISDKNHISSLLHATPENHKLLEQLYGVEFGKPPAKPTPKEIIEAVTELPE